MGSFHGEAGWPVQHESLSATAKAQAIASHRRPCWNMAPLGTKKPEHCAGDDESQAPVPHQGMRTTSGFTLSHTGGASLWEGWGTQKLVVQGGECASDFQEP